MGGSCATPVARSTVAAADARLAWAGGSLAQIRERWSDDGSRKKVLAACGEHSVPSGLDHEVLEQLRGARADVHYLLRLIEEVSGG